MRLHIEKLRLERGGRLLFRDLGFTLEAGEALLVLGPNGAGKSSLLRVLAGLLPPTAGRVVADVSRLRRAGESADAGDESAPNFQAEGSRREPRSGALGYRADAPIAEQAHYVGHADALKSALTVRENLDFAVRLLGGDPARIEAALARMRMSHALDLPVAALSAGQKRRAALARLLAAPRPLWLLDEPTTALDVASQDTLAEVCAEHRAEGGLIVAATHAALGLNGAKTLRLGTAAA